MTGNEALLTFALIAGGFLLGGVMFSRALPKLLTGKDVCALRADKNPGAANVFAVCGVPMGLLCLALDMLKAYLPVSLAAQYLDTQSVWFALALAAPVLGHAVGVFNGFHGGKCIASAFGAMLALALTGVSLTGLLLLAGRYIFFSFFFFFGLSSDFCFSCFSSFSSFASFFFFFSFICTLSCFCPDRCRYLLNSGF